MSLAEQAWWGIRVSSSEGENKARDRQIAQNEARRETVGDVRVSSWAIAAALVAGLIVLGIVLAWLKR